ncbi:MAG TPA: hypothetical protein PLS49_09360, partial [Candidatus Woesebacteria bacterium]|nr:hypothetical protein [Candidatus Woesebacteria bacterium]
MRRKLKQISKFLFFKKITLARWQLNTFTVMMLSLGFVLGTYAMVMELVPILRALDETSYTLVEGGDSELTSGSGTDVVISASAVSLGKDDNWYDMGWNLKKQLTVKNLSSVTLPANTPIQVTLNTKELFDASNLQNDCDDLRIIYSTGVGTHTELTRSYYKASGATDCSDSTATVVTLPIQAELTAGATSGNYYLYYKNSGATNPGFGDNGYNIGDAEATMVCPFNGTTTCVDGETPSTATGALRYSGGGALSFDGNNDNVSVNVSKTGRNAITMEGWMYFPDSWEKDGVDRYHDVFSWFNEFGLVYRSHTGAGHFFRIDSHPIQTFWSPGVNYPKGWNHIAVVWNGNDVKLFFNGEQKATNTNLSTVRNVGANFVVADIGVFDYGAATMFDEVHVTYSEKYTSNFTPPLRIDADSNTKILWHFDENGDDIRNLGKAIDASGNGNHGTINGAKYVSGVVGVDSGVTSTVKGQSYAGHDGLFLEKGTTNLITNPSFEHTTYNTNWGTNYFNYNSSVDTFTAKMAKRNSAGPFASGVLSQGKWKETGYSDQLTWAAGSQISGSFYQNADLNQGSVVLWITPEWNGNDGKLHIIYN